jgi:hypothetical protein
MASSSRQNISRGKNAGEKQKGRQQGSATGREGFKSNSQAFFRHPGQGMRGKDGGRREATRTPGQRHRPKSER